MGPAWRLIHLLRGSPLLRDRARRTRSVPAVLLRGRRTVQRSELIASFAVHYNGAIPRSTTVHEFPAEVTEESTVAWRNVRTHVLGPAQDQRRRKETRCRFSR